MSAPDRRGCLSAIMRVYRSAGNANCCAARSSIYRLPRPANDNDVELMRRTICSRPGRSWARGG
jgi:hypothetical protein